MVKPKMTKNILIAVPCETVKKIKHDAIDREINLTEWVNIAIKKEIQRRKL